jgi:periplasmic divalent cation tolerance protein
LSISIVLSTAGSAKEGRKIGRALVEKGLAACVNVISGANSIFRWEGKVCEEKEVVLLIKTNQRNVKEMIPLIRRLHSYSVPEILSVRVGGGDREYLDWVKKMAGAQGEKERKKLLTENHLKG